MGLPSLAIVSARSVRPSRASSSFAGVALVACALAALAGAGCSAPITGTDAALDAPRCTLDADCPVGRHCAVGVCAAECAIDDDCGPGGTCSTRGRCARPDAGPIDAPGPRDAGPPCTMASQCDDSLACTTDDCVASRCVSTPRSCPDDANPCTSPGVCAEPSGACTSPFDPTSLTSPAHCGSSAAACVVCTATHATRVATCVAGACGETCAPGLGDPDGEASNGCECVVTSAADPADDAAADENCDGADGVAGAGTRFVYVTTTGTGDGTRPSTPASLASAMDLAAGGRTTVLVAAGDYATDVALALPDGIDMHGGYTEDFRSRVAGESRVTSTARTALVISGVTNALVDRVSFSTTDRSVPGEHTQTIQIVGSGASGVRLSRLTITAGAGAAGAGGPLGAAGSDGSAGRDGVSAIAEVAGDGGAPIGSARRASGRGGDGWPPSALFDARFFGQSGGAGDLGGGAGGKIGRAHV